METSVNAIAAENVIATNDNQGLDRWLNFGNSVPTETSNSFDPMDRSNFFNLTFA